MNIFILDKDIELCSQYHNDKHIVKMILEETQLLSTTINHFGKSGPYKTTHLNHPSAKWTRESSANFNWLCEHAIALSREYTYRYNKIHKCESLIRNMSGRTLEIFGNNLDKSLYTPFALCMPDEYKTSDAVSSYRNYYMNDKRDIAKWTRRDIPHWWI